MNSLTKIFIWIVIFFIHSQVYAINLGQIDDFEAAADTANWVGGQSPFSPPPSQVSDGGPDGAGDGYLQISVEGFHLGTHNTSQWSGDYLAIGVNSIELDVNHLAGSDTVGLRILLFGAGGAWATEKYVILPGEAGWEHFEFGIGEDDLVYVSDGNGVLNDTLSNVQKLLIRHDTEMPTIPGFHPPHISGTLGLDNITFTVPEPGGLSVLAIGSLIVIKWR